MPLGQPGQLQLVWPTVEEVRGSLEGWEGGEAIPGKIKTVDMGFMQQYYCRWGGEPAGRQRAVPHMKSYLRYDPCTGEVAWAYVGSANVSCAAWGELCKHGTQLFIRNFELGVLLLPELEAAYRSSRHHGFSCTSGTTAVTTGTADVGSPPSSPLACPAAAAPPAGSAAASLTVRFCRWVPRTRQEARPHPPEGPVPAWAAAATAAGTALPPPLQQQPARLRVPLPIPYALPPRRLGEGEQPWAYDVAWEGEDALGRRKRKWGWERGGLVFGPLEGEEWPDVLARLGL